jgi:hypothetical protein
MRLLRTAKLAVGIPGEASDSGWMCSTSKVTTVIVLLD